MKKKIVLFDVDGTIIDSFEGIINTLHYVANKMGYEVDKSKHTLFIGPPLTYSFSKYLNMKSEDIPKAIDMYRQEYLRKGRFEFRLYDGVINTLDELRIRGKVISTATSKPEFMTEKIFIHENIIDKFDYILGSKHEGDSKLDIIKRAMETCCNNNINDYVLIGDTEFDLDAANEIGMDCIIVKEGYGTRETFDRAKYVVNKIEDILNIIE